MKADDKKLILVFVTLLIIILATFAGTTYYYDTKYISKSKVAEEGLFAKAFVDENVGAAPLNASFSALLFNFETPTCYWEFGDGNTSNETNPTHNYTKEGEYTCNLTVTDITGKIVTTSVKILVVAKELPTVVLSVTPSSSVRPYMLPWAKLALTNTLGDRFFVRFLKNLHDKPSSPFLKRLSDITCEAQVPEGDEIVWYEWELEQPSVKEFGGTQNWPKFVFSGEKLSTLIFPQLYVLRMGGYNIRLTVTDSAGNKRSDSKPFGVSRSNYESVKFELTAKWNDIWGVKFADQPEFIRTRLMKIWLVFGPAHNFTDNMMMRILSPLPPALRDMLYNDIYYNIVWAKRDIKYLKPNWNAPNAPSNPFPADNAMGVPLNTDLLSWNCRDPDGNRITYDVYLGTGLPPPLVTLGRSDTNYALISLEPNTTYYWYVGVKDHPYTGESKTTNGPLWSFTTETV